MPRSMADPNYVYRPRPAEERARLSAAHKRRLGIPEGCVRIYGIHVPQEYEQPLRTYATWIRHWRGAEATVAFIRKAEANGWKVRNKPTKSRLKVSQRGYVYSPRPSTIKRRIAWLENRGLYPPSGKLLYGVMVPAEYVDTIRPHAERVRARSLEAAQWVILEACRNRWPDMAATAPPARAIDFGLVDSLLEEHTPIEDIAKFLEVSPAYLKAKLRERRG